jgi:hypothetical protein
MPFGRTFKDVRSEKMINLLGSKIMGKSSEN